MATIFPMLRLNCLSLTLHFNQVHVQCCGALIVVPQRTIQ